MIIPFFCSGPYGAAVRSAEGAGFLAGSIRTAVGFLFEPLASAAGVASSLGAEALLLMEDDA